MLLGYCNLNLSIKTHRFESVNLCLVQISSQSNTQPPQKVSRHTLMVPMDLGMMLTLTGEFRRVLKSLGFEFQLYYLFYKQGDCIPGLIWTTPSCLLCQNHYYSSAFHSQRVLIMLYMWHPGKITASLICTTFSHLEKI